MQRRKPHGWCFSSSWGEGSIFRSDQCFEHLLVIGGRLQGNLWELRDQSKEISRKISSDLVEHVFDRCLVDTASIQKAS